MSADYLLHYPQRVEFSRTNECLEAISAGLCVGATDRVFAIAGSGDQAFALLEHAKSVTVVDADSKQIKYVRARIAALRKGDKRKFFWPSNQTDMKDRTVFSYFDEGTRLADISKKIDSLEVLDPKDFLESLSSFSSGTFNKIYASNVVFDYLEDHRIGACLPLGGMAYFTQGRDNEIDTLQDGSGRFAEEFSLTRRARELA